ncbi:MAG: TolC family protein [Bacteroidales bacterium]|nr:TolC family protein [Bacteroidales bacterium]
MKKFASTIIFSAVLMTTTATAQTCEWTLQECTNYAVENNLSVKRTEDNLHRQEIQLNTAKNAYLPSVNASVDQNFSFGRGLTADNTYSNTNTRSTSFNLGASVNLFNGFQPKNNVELSKLNLAASTADLEKAKNDIRLQVAQAYVEILYNMEIEDVARRQIEIDSAQVARLEAFVANGKASEAELSQQKASLANSNLTYTQAVNNRKLALLNLSQLLELPSAGDFTIQRPDTFSIENEELSIENYQSTINYDRPEIKAEEIRLESTEYSLRIAKGQALPSLNLSAGMGTNYYNSSNGFKAESFGKQLDNNFSQYIGLNLNIPIFNRFQVRNNIRDVKIQRESQQHSLELARKNLYKEVQQASLNAENANAKVVAAREAVRNAETAFRLAQAKYENGKSTITEFNESKNTLLKSQSDLTQAVYQRMYSIMILKWYQGEEMGW